MPIEVSPTWKRAIQGQFRLPAYMRVSLYVVPPGLREGAQVFRSPVSAAIAPASQIIDGITEPDMYIATLEDGFWPGDGSAYLASEDSNDNLPTGWWSESIDPGPQSFILSLDNQYSFPGLWLVWDVVGNSWPLDLKVVGMSAGAIVAQETFENIGAANKFIALPMENVDLIGITFTGWSKPNVRARLAECTCGLAIQFDNDRIDSSDLNATAELLSEELPQLSMSFTLNNYDRDFDPTLQSGYASYLAQRQLINVQWGFETSYKNIEWLKPWPMYLSGWSVPADSQTVDITASSRLSFLDIEYDRGLFSDNPVPLLYLATDLLSNSAILRRTPDETPWELDPVLSTLRSRAPLPRSATNALLQLIANAAGCTIDTNPENNYVRIRHSCVPADYALTTAQQLGDPSFELLDRLKSITIGLRTFSKQETRKQVYSFKGSLYGKQTLQVEYDASHIVMQPTIKYTGDLISVTPTYYARSAEIVIVAPQEDTYVELQIEGYIVDESTTWIKTYEDTTVASGLEIQVDNPLITEMETLKFVAETVKDMYTRRVTAKIPYLGYPELQTGDTIPCTTHYGAFKGDITGVSLSFNGGFDGEITAKMLNVGALDRAGKGAWYSDEIFSGEVF